MSGQEQRFTVTDEHLALARAMYVSWNGMEFGAPSVDPKRPYGNGDVINDMANILGHEPDWEADPDGGVGATLAAELRSLHAEMETALQIFLSTGTFAAGEYRAEPYFSKWERVSGS